MPLLNQVSRAGRRVRLSRVLGVCLLFICSCVTIESDHNKVDPAVFNIFGNIVIIACSLILIFATIIISVITKNIVEEEAPSFFNWCKRFFGW